MKHTYAQLALGSDKCPWAEHHIILKENRIQKVGTGGVGGEKPTPFNIHACKRIRLDRGLVRKFRVFFAACVAQYCNKSKNQECFVHSHRNVNLKPSSAIEKKKTASILRRLPFGVKLDH
jgi:hypothetical protein